MSTVLCMVPHYRLFGSRRNDIPPSLVNIMWLMLAVGKDVYIYNGDSGPPESPILDWTSVWYNYPLYRWHIDSESSPIMEEVAAGVLSLEPDVIVLVCGDPSLATVDIGTGEAAMALAAHIRRRGYEGLLLVTGAEASLLHKHRARLKHTGTWLWIDGGGVINGSIWLAPHIDLKAYEAYKQAFWKHLPLDGMPDVQTCAEALKERIYPRENIDAYSLYTVLHYRGCSYSECNFCPIRALRTVPRCWRSEAFPVEKQIEARLLAFPEYKKFYIGDLDFAPTAFHLSEYWEPLARLAEKHNLTYTAEMRVHTVLDRSEEELESILKYVSTVRLGIEAGTDDLLRLYGKGTNMKEIAAAISKLRSLGARRITGFCLLGPGTKEQRQQSVEGMASLGLDYYTTNLLCPYPGTPFYEQYREEIHRVGLIDAYTGLFRGLTHLSHDVARFWGIEEDEILAYLHLSEDELIAYSEEQLRQGQGVFLRKIISPPAS